MAAELGQRGFQAYDPVYEGRNAEILYQGLHEPDGLSGPILGKLGLNLD
jgi:hypothetical protein